MFSVTSSDQSVLSKDKHVKYWLRCLKTYLPGHYVSNDSNRMTLALFTLSALDLLGVLHERTTIAERVEYIDWIYLCQHPSGGFRGFTGSNFGDELRNGKNGHWDPANLAGTFFALAALAVLGDEMERVKRKECLEWLTKLQCEDGRFGEVLGTESKIEGGGDVRFCYLATVVRWILRGTEQEYDDVKDIDIDKLATFIMASQTYDGGIAKTPYNEAHAGETYCGIAALSLLGRLPRADGEPLNLPSATSPDESFVQDVLSWLVHRQTTTLTEEEQSFQIFNRTTPTEEESSWLQHEGPTVYDGIVHSEHGAPISEQEALRNIPGHSVPTILHGVSVVRPLASPSLTALFPPEPEDKLWIGFNGRCNKFADTCYCFWAGGTLGILKKTHLISSKGVRRYLLEKTQHIVGGFGKLPGDHPDVLHSYLGLAALAVLEEPGLKSLDPTLCISSSARAHLDSLPWRSGAAASRAQDPTAAAAKREAEEHLSNIAIHGG